MDQHVGRRLAEIRIGGGHTQTDLARALGVTFQQVQQYEKGANRVSASKLWESATYLNVGVDAFFEGLTDQAQMENDPSQPAPSRASIELARLSRRLSPKQQKLALDLMLSLAGRLSAPEDGEG